MSIGQRRLGLSAAAFAGAILAIGGCSTQPAAGNATTAESTTSPMATSVAPLPTSTATAPTPASSSTGTSTPALPTAEVTSTPGLQLRGPQPIPAAQHVIPTRVRIPAIAVDSTLQALRTKAGVLQPPTDPLRAGWWADGPVPGDPGPAVIAGHLDSYTGPAVFIYLSELRAGDVIDVSRSDGTTVAFVVDAVQTYEKSAFPTAAVYGATPGSALRLITCGGTFDRAKQVYLANVVVYASLRS